MTPIEIAVTLIGLVGASTALGLAWKSRSGRVTRVSPRRTASTASNIVTIPEISGDSRATLLQFSTAVCAPCVPTRTLLGDLAEEIDGVRHVDVDIAARPELASKFTILQTPTTLILDAQGVVRARIGGAPRRADVRAALATILVA